MASQSTSDKNGSKGSWTLKTGLAQMLKGGVIMDAVTIPVMAKARIGHFVEAQVLEAIGVDYVDESEVLTPADLKFHIDKHAFKVPFVCGARELGEALRRINEGARVSSARRASTAGSQGREAPGRAVLCRRHRDARRRRIDDAARRRGKL